jgi:hypothetical protein
MKMILIQDLYLNHLHKNISLSATFVGIYLMIHQIILQIVKDGAHIVAFPQKHYVVIMNVKNVLISHLRAILWLNRGRVRII